MEAKHDSAEHVLEVVVGMNVASLIPSLRQSRASFGDKPIARHINRMRSNKQITAPSNIKRKNKIYSCQLKALSYSSTDLKKYSSLNIKVQKMTIAEVYK